MTSSTSARLTSGLMRGGLVLALAAMFGWSPAPVAAQATGTLVGTVRDAATQRPLEAVQVYIGGTGIGALTNAAGRFLLLNVPAGEHSLVAELVGYRSGAQTVTVGSGESVVADFGLEQTAITLDQIVVTGAGVATEKRKLGNTIATLDGASLDKAQPSSGVTDVLEGLLSVPLVADHAALADLGPIETRFALPQPTWHGHDQVFYRLRDTTEFLVVDLAVMRRSARGLFNEGERHGTGRVLFDRTGVAKPVPLDRGEHVGLHEAQDAPVRADGPLRPTRGAARVQDHARVVLRERRVGKARIGRLGDQVPELALDLDDGYGDIART